MDISSKKYLLHTAKNVRNILSIFVCVKNVQLRVIF